MRIGPHRFCAVILLSLLISGCKPEVGREQERTHEVLLSDSAPTRITGTLQEPDSVGTWFGWTDSSGTRLLLAETKHPFTTGSRSFAILPSGDVIPLEHPRHRKKVPSWNGRETASEFDAAPGVVFDVPERRLEADATYLVVDSIFLTTHTPLAVAPRLCLEISPDSLSTQSILPGRPEQAWRLARMDGASVTAMRFAGSPPLAGLTLISGDSAWTEALPGAASDSQSVWRVDDEGNFDGCAFTIRAAFVSKAGISVARSWAGPEGESSVLLRPDSARLVPVLKGYRYWSAM